MEEGKLYKKKKEKPSKNFTAKILAELLQIFTNSLKSLKTWTPTLKGFHYQKTNSALSAYNKKYDEKETNQANHHLHISEE